jgi:hypothetical protein
MQDGFAPSWQLAKGIAAKMPSNLQPVSTTQATKNSNGQFSPTGRRFASGFRPPLHSIICASFLVPD